MDKINENLKTLEIKDSVAKKLEGLTVDQVICKPIWSTALQPATFTSLTEFEESRAQWEEVIQQHLLDHDFNTFGSYTEFYKGYPVSIDSPLNYYRKHEAVLNPEYFSCTGLSIQLLKSLQLLDRQFGPYFALVSSEEGIQEVANSKAKYDIESRDVVMRHVLVCLKFVLSESGRIGYVLLDSGYSLPRAIVVMRDGNYPHTGRFISVRISKREQRNYQLVMNDSMIQWELHDINRQTGELSKSPKINLIYIEKKFQSYKTFSRKRGLIVSIKVCVVRNRTGPVALFYSLVKKKNLIILYRQSDNTVVEQQFLINELEKEEVKQALKMVALCSAQNDQSIAEKKMQKYMKTLRDYRKTLYDTNFSSDMCQLDKWFEGRQQKIGQLM